MMQKMVIAVVCLSVLIIVFLSLSFHSSVVFGASFDPGYARYLGLDAGRVYGSLLDELQFKKLRLSAVWEEIERSPGQYDFSDLDYYFNEAAKRGAQIVLAVGQKTPRWPECHIPQWAQNLPEDEYRTALLAFLTQVAIQYKYHPALEIWQVENELFLPFGAECKNLLTTREVLLDEIDRIREIDAEHPILITDSGELSSWRKTAPVGDLFGTTMYRVVWNKYLGYWSYDWLPPVFYRLKLWLNNRPADEAYIVELQAEPWIPDRPIEQTPLAEQFKSMSPIRLQKNITYAQRVGFSRAYLWGAEWWYWLKEKGEVEILETVKTLPK